MTLPRLLRLAAALVLTSASGLALAAPPQAFTATYRVLRDGSPMGEATVSLKPLGNGQWEYSKHIRGTSGLAAMLGAKLDEVSHVRWKGDVPEAVSYDYRLDAAIKSKRRHVTVDWAKRQVTVDEGKGAITYPAKPGMVERNTTALAIGLALRHGQPQIALPVAVKQEVETQRFKVSGKEKVTVPAGSFDAVRVDRSDADRGFSAWYVPERYPLPVKLSQHDGGDLTMELVGFSQR
ncbi:DUF3108 domain-containing protein [Frateuria sp. STR12]|uniref:DUF3108 domain-containing protein n=1 Tax=Frateuria hangzhouensis TaxID=2995589 RepID=UPI0022609BE1|nr:DUF3108 domain-containing protein [Frateuria sp. STR12]MCX7514038.1 DUF3108 domain-containing protein [Frateuria sp. STR12]